MSLAKNMPGIGPKIAVMVEEFMTAMGQDADIMRQLTLIEEESMEVVEAAALMDINPSIETAEAFLKEVADYYYVNMGLMLLIDIVGSAEAEACLRTEKGMNAFATMQFAGQFVEVAGRQFLNDSLVLEAITEVHRSNMSKLGDDGLPIRREDGKILKGPNYQAPDLSNLAGTVLEGFLDFRRPSRAA
jgi:hypothetical protein